MNIRPAWEYQPGIEGYFEGLDESVYRKAPGINISSLKHALNSPLHYKSALDKPSEPTEAMELGTIIHLAILQPERLSNSFVVRPDWITDFRSAKAKEWRDKQTLPILTADEANAVYAIADNVRANEFMSAAIASSNIELSGFKRDPQTGAMIKARADMVAAGSESLWVFDVKTVRSGVAGREFECQVADFDYHLQAAWYLDVFGANRFAFVAVEKEAPYDWAIWELEASDIELATRVNRRLLDEAAQCHERNEWPGYNKQAIGKLSLPAWKRKQHELYA